MEWWLDNVRIGTREQPPFVLPWNPYHGEHTLVVRAFDLAGNMGESELVELPSITVITRSRIHFCESVIFPDGIISASSFQ